MNPLLRSARTTFNALRRAAVKQSVTPLSLISGLAVVLGSVFLFGAIAAPNSNAGRDEPTTTDAPWIELKKGLKVRDLVEGTGTEAKRGKRASMRYAGWLEDGTQFDSNRGDDLLVFEIGGGRVVKGWELGVVGMKVGGTRQLLIPPKLAYGKRGVRDRIPPDATLLFEVDLRGVF